VLPFTSDLFRVIVPWFTMPAPLVWLAVLLSTAVLFRMASPPFAMPPAAIGGAPGPGGAVAVLPSTWLLLSTRWLVPSWLRMTMTASSIGSLAAVRCRPADAAMKS